MEDIAKDLTNLNIRGLSAPRGLESVEQKELLDTIDNLRHLGVGKLFDLPQLIVCGVQSSGKSSVMEAISGVPFPRAGRLCTRFPTEVVLRPASSTSVTVTIHPAGTREGDEREKLLAFKQVFNSYDEFPDVFTKASEAMGLPEAGVSAFSDDIMKVEVRGPEQPQLTLVDLPGLIQSSEQSNIDLVEDMVQSYMSSKRSVILAVIHAGSDYETQRTLNLTKKHDPEGERSLGILTKPDVLENEPEKEAPWIELVRNEKVRFKLGWHVVRNVDSGRGHSTKQEKLEARDKIEADYFAASTSFREDLSRNLEVGVVALRRRLSKMLFHQVQKYLPDVMKEIERGIEDANFALRQLGRACTTEIDQRSFLGSLGTRFASLCGEGMKGFYDDPFFRQETNAGAKLCAAVLNAHKDFATQVDKDGRAWRISESEGQGSRARSVARSAKLREIHRLMEDNRGLELPGQINSSVIRELFRRYSEPWKSIAQDHLQTQFETVRHFSLLVIRYLADEETANKIFSRWISQELKGLYETAKVELNKVLGVYSQQPMTANHLFLERICQIHRKDKRRANPGVLHGSENDDTDIDGSVVSDEPFSLFDLQSVTAELALESVEAYYDATVGTFVDNVLTLCIWTPIIMQLQDVFSSEVVWNRMDLNTIRRLAGESEEKQARRADLQRKLQALENGKKECEPYSIAVGLANQTFHPSLKLHDEAPKAFDRPSSSSARPSSAHIPRNPSSSSQSRLRTESHSANGQSTPTKQRPSSSFSATNYNPGASLFPTPNNTVPSGGSPFISTSTPSKHANSFSSSSASSSPASFPGFGSANGPGFGGSTTSFGSSFNGSRASSHTPSSKPAAPTMGGGYGFPNRSGTAESDL